MCCGKEVFRFVSAKKSTATVAYILGAWLLSLLPGKNSSLSIAVTNTCLSNCCPFRPAGFFLFHPPLSLFTLTYSSSPNRPVEDFQIPPPETPVTCIYKVQYSMIAGGRERGGALDTAVTSCYS